MIKVTPSAKRLLAEMVRQARRSVQAPEEDAITLRLLPNGEEWGVVLDSSREGDQIVERGGHPVLLVGSDVGTALDGATIETEHTPQGERLAMSFPN